MGWENVRFIEDVIMVYNLHHGNDFMGDIQPYAGGIGRERISSESVSLGDKPHLAKLAIDK